MCMYSRSRACPAIFHLVHYGSPRHRRAGLVFTEMTCVSRDARITPGCAGLWNDEQEAAWRRIVDFVHANSAAKIALQLAMPAAKGATKLMWDGNRPSAWNKGGWDVVSAFAEFLIFPTSIPRENGPCADGGGFPKASFVDAANTWRALWLDMLELHCAHGYLLASFISPLTNQRTDAYGGSLEARLRFPLEVFAVLRAAWPAPQADVGAHLPPPTGPKAASPAMTRSISRGPLRKPAVDLVDVSTGPDRARRPAVYGRMFQTPFSEQVRKRSARRDHVRR